MSLLEILTFPFVFQTWNCPALTLSLVFSWLGKDVIVIFPAWKIQLKQVEEKQSEMIQASWNSVIVVGDGKSSGLDIRAGIDALFFNSLDQKFWSFIFGGLVKPHLWATQLESLSLSRSEWGLRICNSITFLGDIKDGPELLSAGGCDGRAKRGQEEPPHVRGQGQKPGGPHAWRAAAKRSYPASEVGGAAERRYPASEVRGSDERSYPASEVRGRGGEEIPQAPKPKARGSGWEELPQAATARPGAVAGRSNPTSKEPWLRQCKRA